MPGILFEYWFSRTLPVIKNGNYDLLNITAEQIQEIMNMPGDFPHVSSSQYQDKMMNQKCRSRADVTLTMKAVGKNWSIETAWYFILSHYMTNPIWFVEGPENTTGLLSEKTAAFLGVLDDSLMKMQGTALGFIKSDTKLEKLFDIPWTTIMSESLPLYWPSPKELPVDGINHEVLKQRSKKRWRIG